MYHYTTINKLDAIARDGKLKPTATLLAKGEKPALWFSTNPKWEPTAAKANLFGRPYTYEEHVEQLGLVRFELKNTSLVLPWKRLIKRAQIPNHMVIHLVDKGLKQGAIPSQWYGTLKSIPLSKLRFQVLDDGVWLDYDSPDMNDRLKQWLSEGV